MRLMKDLICPKCGSEMYFDDSDYDFPGKGTEWFVCSNEKCNCGMIQEIRFHKVYKREWSWDDEIQKVEKFDINALDGGEF